MRHVKEDEVLSHICNEAKDAGFHGDDLESILDSIDYIKVGQNEVTVIWKKTGK